MDSWNSPDFGENYPHRLISYLYLLFCSSRCYLLNLFNISHLRYNCFNLLLSCFNYCLVCYFRLIHLERDKIVDIFKCTYLIKNVHSQISWRGNCLPSIPLTGDNKFRFADAYVRYSASLNQAQRCKSQLYFRC